MPDRPVKLGSALAGAKVALVSEYFLKNDVFAQSGDLGIKLLSRLV